MHSLSNLIWLPRVKTCSLGVAVVFWSALQLTALAYLIVWDSKDKPTWQQWAWLPSHSMVDKQTVPHLHVPLSPSKPSPHKRGMSEGPSSLQDVAGGWANLGALQMWPPFPLLHSKLVKTHTPPPLSTCLLSTCLMPHCLARSNWTTRSRKYKLQGSRIWHWLPIYHPWPLSFTASHGSKKLWPGFVTCPISFTTFHWHNLILPLSLCNAPLHTVNQHHHHPTARLPLSAPPGKMEPPGLVQSLTCCPKGKVNKHLSNKWTKEIALIFSAFRGLQSLASGSVHPYYKWKTYLTADAFFLFFNAHLQKRKLPLVN